MHSLTNTAKIRGRLQRIEKLRWSSSRKFPETEIVIRMSAFEVLQYRWEAECWFAVFLDWWGMHGQNALLRTSSGRPRTFATKRV